MCLASTLDYADSTYPYMKGMLIVALEGEVENTEVQLKRKLKYMETEVQKVRRKATYSYLGLSHFAYLTNKCSQISEKSV